MALELPLQALRKRMLFQQTYLCIKDHISLLIYPDKRIKSAIHNYLITTQE